MSWSCLWALAACAPPGPPGRKRLQALLRQGRALHVVLHRARVDRLDLLAQLLALLMRYEVLPPGSHRANLVRVVAQVRLRADEYDRHFRTVVAYFRHPLAPDVLVRGPGDHAVADEEHVSLGVGQHSQAVVVLLSCCVPETQVDRHSVHDDVCVVVVEHCRDVLAREGVSGVGDEHALNDGASYPPPRRRRRRTSRSWLPSQI